MSVKSIAMNAYMNEMANSMRQAGKAQQSINNQVAKKLQRAPELRTSFEDTVKQSLNKVNDMQAEKKSMIEEFASGKRQNVHELMITMQKAGLAMQMTSNVRNKVMQAYQEVMRMPF